MLDFEIWKKRVNKPKIKNTPAIIRSGFSFKNSLVL